MIPTLAFEELAIFVKAKNHNHTLVNPDFLKSTGIVPSNWELAEPPAINSQMAKIQFTNGTIVSAQANGITFSQTTEAEALKDILIPAIVRKYVEILPNADYQGIGINPSSFLTFEDESEKTFRHYISTQLLSPGNWHELGSQPVRASLSLAYTLERGEFNLKIDDIRLRDADNTLQAGVLFSGNFPYQISGNTTQEKLQQLYQLIELWQEDLETYREIVNQRFFGSKERTTVLNSTKALNWN